MKRGVLRTGPALLGGLALYTAFVGYLTKLPCRVFSWDEPEMFWRLCYSDLPVLYARSGMNEGRFPYLDPDSLLEYPALQSVAATITGMLSFMVHGTVSVHIAKGVYFDVNAVLLALVWMLVVLLVARWVRPLHAVLLALSPAAAVTLFINWDLWAVLFMVLAFVALRRERLWWAGAMIGVGTAFKLFPFLLLGPLLVLALRRRSAGLVLKPTLAAAVAWLVCNVPFALLDWNQWSYFWTFSQDRDAGFSSVWSLVDRVMDMRGLEHLSPGTMNVLAMGLMVLACVGVLLLGLLARTEPDVEQLAFLVLGVFVLVNKVYSPQFVLWLIPLYFMVRPRTVEYLVWQLVEVVHWVAVFSWLGYLVTGQEHGHWSDVFYPVMVLLHVLVLGWIMARVSGDVLQGERGGEGFTATHAANAPAPWDTERNPPRTRGVRT